MLYSEHAFHHLGPYRFMVYPIILLLIIIEGIWSWRKNREQYQIKETMSNTVILVGYISSKIILASYQLAILAFASKFAFFHLPVTIPMIILTFIVTDLCFYWYHRVSHQVKFFWAFHLTHHSSQAMNLTTAYRINWFSAFLSPYFFIPAALLGFDPTVIVISYALNLFYQFFMHTEAVGKLPIVEGIFNTPSAHRVHHGSNEIYLDKNYGGVFVFWDRLFGTYQEETEPVKYGITTGFVSYNPLVIIFHGFVDLAKGKMDYKG
jgi:sterol desaturase/sphingolipid hydroxylase (fatty acid hydroxylase superfamily)